jgi:hypothetical protein
MMNKIYTYTNSKGTKYFLNHKGHLTYFSRDERPETGCWLPDGMMVIENLKTGMPMIKKEDK